MDPGDFPFHSFSNNTVFLPASPISDVPVFAETPNPIAAPPKAAPPSHLRSKGKGAKSYISPYPPVQHKHVAPTSSPVPHSTRPSGPTRSGRARASVTRRFVEPPINNTQKRLLVQALNEHRINTLIELWRIERIFAELDSSDLTQPMTGAWSFFVNSHSLLNEIRQRCPSFSSECLDEAKRRVYEDPASNRSWNLCWLVLRKIQSDGLIPGYAQMQALRLEMWGGEAVSRELVEQLKDKFVHDWTAMLAQLMRHWERPPTNA